MPVLPEARTGAEICVDPAALRRLAETLRETANRLCDHSVNYPDVGDLWITPALRDVQRDWSRAREAVSDFLASASDAARSAADGYAEVEQAICRAEQR